MNRSSPTKDSYGGVHLIVSAHRKKGKKVNRPLYIDIYKGGLYKPILYISILYLCTYIYVCFAASAASPAPIHPSIKEAAFGRLHNSGAGAFGARPTAVDSFMDGCMGAGEAADAAKHT